MPRFRIETNHGVFEIDANRAPTEAEIREMMARGELRPTGEEGEQRPTAPPMATRPPSLRELITSQAFGPGLTTGQAPPPEPEPGATRSETLLTTEGLPFVGRTPSQPRPDVAREGSPLHAESLQQELAKPIPQAAIGMPTEIASEMGGQQIGALLGGAIGSRAGPVGRTIGTAAGRVIGGGAASAASALAQKRARGEQVTRQDVGDELLLSYLPEAIESSFRAGGRQLARLTKGGQELRMDEAARVALRDAPRVFDAPGRKATSQMFQQVEQTGLRFDLTDLRTTFDDMTEQLDDIVRFDIRTIDRQGRTGKRFESMIQRIRDGENVPIGDLQDLRSILLKRERQASPDARRVIESMRSAVDDAVDNAPAVPGAALANVNTDEVRALLQTARRDWKRVRSAEDLATLLGTRPVSSVARSGRMMRFNTNALLNTLRDNKTGLARTVNDSMRVIPGPRVAVDSLGRRPQKFAAYLEELKRIAPPEIRLSDTQGLSRLAFVAAGTNILADMMTSRLGQRVLQRALVKGRGTLSINQLAILANITRRHADTLQEAGASTVQKLDAIANDLVESVFTPQFPETADQPLAR